MNGTRLLLVAILVLAAVAPGVVSADHMSGDDEDDPSLVEIVTESSWLGVEAFRGEAAGWLVRQRARIGEPPEPAAQAEDLQAFINDNDQQLVDHANDVVDEYDGSVSNATYVLEVTVDENDAGDESSFYVVATGDGEDVTGLEATTSTDHTADRESSLTASEAEALVEDLETYKDDYVDPGKVPSEGYLVRIGSKYTTVSEIRGG